MIVIEIYQFLTTAIKSVADFVYNSFKGLCCCCPQAKKKEFPIFNDELETEMQDKIGIVSYSI